MEQKEQVLRYSEGVEVVLNERVKQEQEEAKVQQLVRAGKVEQVKRDETVRRVHRMRLV